MIIIIIIIIGAAAPEKVRHVRRIIIVINTEICAGSNPQDCAPFLPPSLRPAVVTSATFFRSPGARSLAHGRHKLAISFPSAPAEFTSSLPLPLPLPSHCRRRRRRRRSYAFLTRPGRARALSDLTRRLILAPYASSCNNNKGVAPIGGCRVTHAR